MHPTWHLFIPPLKTDPLLDSARGFLLLFSFSSFLPSWTPHKWFKISVSSFPHGPLLLDPPKSGLLLYHSADTSFCSITKRLFLSRLSATFSKAFLCGANSFYLPALAECSAISIYRTDIYWLSNMSQTFRVKNKLDMVSTCMLDYYFAREDRLWSSRSKPKWILPDYLPGKLTFKLQPKS